MRILVESGAEMGRQETAIGTGLRQRHLMPACPDLTGMHGEGHVMEPAPFQGSWIPERKRSAKPRLRDGPVARTGRN